VGAVAGIVVLTEDVLPAEILAAALRRDGRLRVIAVIPDRIEREPTRVQHSGAADVLVCVATRPAGSPRWQELADVWGAPMVVVDLTGQLGVEQAVLLGAQGYAGPYDTWTTLIHRVQDVAEGKTGFPAEGNEPLRKAFRQLDEAAMELERLTETQRQLAQWVAEGLAAKEMARRLDISETAVRDRLRRLMGKLGVSNLQQLAALVGRSGLRSGGSTPQGEGEH
jgi:DNA-binding NarL/FixJ family response regulator